ncbi:MarR family winged helix-turn-helix transcriptional regulator [Arthrobacter sp. H20]|uniref:MarR family winged helix-turn-helix transcriptional regulator n=1 Tax=Arthrobacter sp. H20 TaxID=1267981 RepID=UPI0004798F4A|nr:MarR family winged helix-turn-helix transcriptional regulator [Arthrobacter sp. H20]
MQELEQWPTGRLLTTAARLVDHAWNAGLSDLGLTHAGFTALRVLQDNGPINQTKLAQLIRVQNQTMGKTIEKLQVNGYVERARGEVDQRIQMVSVSESGRTALARAQKIEQSLVAGGGLLSETLRTELRNLIDELGAGRTGGPQTAG